MWASSETVPITCRAPIARATAGNVEVRPPGALDQPFKDGGEVLHTLGARKPPQISDSSSAGVRVGRRRLLRGRHRGNLLRVRHSTDDFTGLENRRARSSGLVGSNLTP